LSSKSSWSLEAALDCASVSFVIN